MIYLPRISHFACFALLAAALIPCLIQPTSAQAESHVVGQVQAATPVSLALALPLRNQSLLTQLLHRLYDPQDSMYHQFLTPAQFDVEFGPSPQDYRAAATYAQAQGLTVTGMHSGRMLLDLTGPAAAVERAFGVRLTEYVSPHGRTFHAPNAVPAIPAALVGHVCAVIGLDTSVLRHPNLVPMSAQPRSTVEQGSGPGGGLAPLDIKAAYGLDDVTMDGSGQTLAVFELDGYSLSDVRTYESYFGLPQVLLQNVLVDGFTGQAGANSDETTLDIELITALAARARRVMVYEGPNTSQGIVDTYTRIADDDQAGEISTSWGSPEDQTDTGTLDAENAAFMKMAAQGQAIFSATGDNGAFDDGQAYLPGTTTENPTVDDPGSQPYVTSVGGTNLTVNAVGGTEQAEVVWNSDTINTDGTLNGNGAGGGGVSSVWNLATTLGQDDYQQGLSATNGQASATMRNVPDVALDSDPDTGYAIYVGGQWVVYGGTSTAAPLWAGFTALVNQQRMQLGKTAIGFVNPAIYAIGKGQTGNYSQDFHDITSGNNLYYSAATGYDLVSGWGSFNGAALLSDLAGSTPPAAQTGPFSYPAGLNFFSLPYDDSGIALNSLFGYSNVSLYDWDPTTSQYLITPTPPADHVRLGTGYWVRFPQAVTTQANGTAADMTRPFTGLTVSPGWNQIGDPFTYPIALANLQFVTLNGSDMSYLGAEEAGLISGLLYCYNPATNSYVPLTEGGALQPGQAYWLYATQSLTVQVPPP